MTYPRPIAIFRFLDTNAVPVQKKGLTRHSTNDNVHLGTRKSVIFRLRVHHPDRDGWPFRNQAGSNWGLPDLVEAFLRKMGPMLCLKANSFGHRDLKKAYWHRNQKHPFRADCV